MTEQFTKSISKTLKNQHFSSKKQQRKGENPVRIAPSQELHFDGLCKNSACRATLSADERCSCCICHSFDDNKDPSLWLECTSCGLSCHIECALQRGKVGVVDLGLFMHLDGSYCCPSCGKVSGILTCWKKQLLIAKDARCVDVLCYRICLSYRLLDGTSRFNELHEFVIKAKAMLEIDVGPVDGVSDKMDRGIVSGLSVAVEVQRLCSLAVEKADELMSSKSTAATNLIEGTLPGACKFLFEEVTSSSIVVLLIELSNSLDDDIKGYKLWYCKSKDENYSEEPVSVFPKDQRRIWLSNLQPCTEYSVRIISYTDKGDFGHSELKCFTKSVDKDINMASSTAKKLQMTEKDIESDSGFKVRDLGRILRLALAQEQCCLSSFCIPTEKIKLETQEEKLSSASFQLDLNVSSVPDLNEEFTPPVESEGNPCTFGQEMAAVDSGLTGSHKRIHNSGNNGEMQDSDSTLSNDSGCLHENFEYCVKMIRWMECEGYIEKDFRLKLLTWFSLRSTEQERRVVDTFIQTLIDDPSSLAGQLVDSFSEIVSRKRPRNDF